MYIVSLIVIFTRNIKMNLIMGQLRPAAPSLGGPDPKQQWHYFQTKMLLLHVLKRDVYVFDPLKISQAYVSPSVCVRQTSAAVKLSVG